jgi:hypothetical protein
VTVPLGSIVYLASYMIRTRVKAEVTMPDTPDMYGADLEVVDDHGEMDVTNLAGKPGRDGEIGFALRRQPEEYEDKSELPDDTVLSNTGADRGKYWVITKRDAEGTVTSQWAYIWYGNQYRKTYMGTQGPPGRVPDVRPSAVLIDPKQESFIETTGGTVNPSWRFKLAVPEGPPGPSQPLADFPDFTPVTGLSVVTKGTEIPFPAPSKVGTGDVEAKPGMVVMFNGEYNRYDQPVWSPRNIMALNPQAYSVPQSAFVGYSGITQKVSVGSFELPPQPFDWTPVVWGHMGMGGATLSSNPLMIGCEVLLGDPNTGIRLARGMGNGMGEVNIMPHYSTPTEKNKNVTPTNRHAVIPAGHTLPAQGTVYVNLNNDGQWSAFQFSPRNAQLFVLVVPIEAYETYTPTTTTRKVRR